jgi:HSP20 family molecular chaperone IbpA
MARDEVMNRPTEAAQGGQGADRQSAGEVRQAGRQDVRASGQQGVDRQGGGSSRDDTRALLPRCDVLEDDQGITVLADLPGVSKDMLELKVDGDTLMIEGTVSAAMPQQMEAVYVEVRVPRFRRAFTLSRELDTEKIEANLANGVLRLRIPKKAHAQPKKIEVQVR